LSGTFFPLFLSSIPPSFKLAQLTIFSINPSQVSSAYKLYAGHGTLTYYRSHSARHRTLTYYRSYSR
jgi:hypothetical protein